MNIRRALDRDAQGIAYVHTESWKTTYRGIMPDYVLDHLTTESRLPQWERQLRTGEKDQILVVAEDRYGEIVGFACGGKEREGKLPYDGEIYAIYLLQSYQQSGIGRQLVKRVVRHLQMCEIGNMVIWALERNPACRFYEKMGGIPVHKQCIRIGDIDLAEIAYAWSDLTSFDR
ncbi:MAG: GNAT family N-acetyltransferase [Paenibacillus sp.]|uniref:GNAT family N-acetyltransferase n=1 Tax=Paenibacillus sp. TaxID=58172 RepID=UPI0025F4EED7|nr:GNAT family N-acetyltransferase [Paenibacillus sp.]MBR2566798.1 GNAT family N-acetyltransferase [Paenibacillus sp.]